MMNRRNALKLTALATVAVASTARAAEISTQPKPGLSGQAATPAHPAVAVTPGVGYSVPDLPYPFDALEPHIDAKTMEIHHNRHHRAYAASLGVAVAKHPEMGFKPPEELLRHLDQVPADIRDAVRNFGGGHANHTYWWKILTKGALAAPRGEFHVAIEKQFNGFAGFKTKFTDTAKGLFGSGWIWLTMDPAKNLRIETTANQDSPLTAGRIPLLALDVWVNAFYLKYQNRRADYIEAFFSVINWDFITERYLKGEAA